MLLGILYNLVLIAREVRREELQEVLVQTSKAAFVLDKDMRPVLKPAGKEVLDTDMNQD